MNIVIYLKLCSLKMKTNNSSSFLWVLTVLWYTVSLYTRNKKMIYLCLPEPAQRTFSSIFSIHSYQWPKGTWKKEIHLWRQKQSKELRHCGLLAADVQPMSDWCSHRSSIVALPTSSGEIPLLQANASDRDHSISTTQNLNKTKQSLNTFII